MSGNVIQNCINVIDLIYEEYNTSKLPKFIKKRKLNKRLKEMERLINGLTKNQSIVTSKLIYDYVYILATTMAPFTQYRSCTHASIASISSGNHAVAFFNIPLHDSEVASAIISITSEDISTCCIEYAYVKDGDPLFTFIEKDVKGLIYTNSIEDIDNGDITNKFRFTKDIIAKNIASDIDIYLKNIMRGKKDDE